jgi:ABC-2 type transport system permease protein
VSPPGLSSARTFGALVVAGFRRFATYRTATLAGAFTNTFFGVVKLLILLAAAAAAGGSVAGYDRAALSTYAWLAQGMIAVIMVFPRPDQAERVRSGQIAIDLGRPVHPVVAWLAEDVGRAGQACLIRFLAPLAFGGLVFGLRVPQRPETVVLFAVSVALAVVVSFAARLLVNLTAFWLYDVRGLLTLFMVGASVLSGLVVPVAFFPGWLRTLAYCTPFPAMLQTPVDVAVERADRAGLLLAVGVQAGWAAGLLALAVLVLHRGTRRLVVQGG